MIPIFTEWRPYLSRLWQPFRRRAARRAAPSYRPFLERLENRITPSVGNLLHTFAEANHGQTYDFFASSVTAVGSNVLVGAAGLNADVTTSSNTTHKLTVGKDGTMTVANDAKATFSSRTQSITLHALVTSGRAVNEGTVTFALFDPTDTTQVGTAVTSAVKQGKASVRYSLPGGSVVGTYQIHATYNPGKDFTTSNDNTHTLTVGKDGTMTVATDAKAIFSSLDQSVNLTATVTPGTRGSAVNEGTVTFMLFNPIDAQVGTPLTSATVKQGKASVRFTLPSGSPVGTYQIRATYNPGTNPDFTTSIDDRTHTLTVSTDTTRTAVVSNETAIFSSHDQSVNLEATVTPHTKNSEVNEGTITFTLFDPTDTTQVGTAVTSDTVAQGKASVRYSLPGGSPVGTYHIHATYNPVTTNPDFTTSSDNTHTLTVGKDGTMTVATDATATFSSRTQSVTLQATVTPDTIDSEVNEGTVTFALFDPTDTTQVGTAVTSDTVEQGNASVLYSLPDGSPVGTYRIHATYNPGTNPDFTTSSDNTHTLTVGKDGTMTVATDAKATFSSGIQSVTLQATVTPDTIDSEVNEGTVTFALFDPIDTTQVGTAVTSAVKQGKASVRYSLPGGSVVGTYHIHATYNPGTDFTTSSDNTHTLTVGKDGTMTVATDAKAIFSSLDQSVNLTATVTPGTRASAVNEGTVTFTLFNADNTEVGTAVTSDTVAQGKASVSYTLPGGSPVGTFHIDATYNPATTNPDFTPSSDTTHTLTVGKDSTMTVVRNATFTGGDSSVTLQATVTPGPNSTNGSVVNEGTVVFTLVNANNTKVGMMLATVDQGSASVSYNLANLRVGSYHIHAAYLPETTNPDFTASTATTNGTLTIGAAGSYVGTYVGKITVPGFPPPQPISGAVQFTVDSSGHVTVTAPAPGTGTVTGGSGSLRLHGGQGTYSFTGVFVVSATGYISASGTWLGTATISGVTGSGAGDWQANQQP